MLNKALQLVPALRASTGQFLSCGFVVLLRKIIPQNRNLKTAAELSVMFRRERNMQYFLSIIISIFLCSCSSFKYRTADEHANIFLGNGAKACGNVTHNQDSLKAQGCILESLKKGTNFYSWYWLEPVDSFPAAGVIFKNGNLYIAWYDSGGILSGSNFVLTQCISWKLSIENQKPLICNIKKGKKAYLFDLATFIVVNENPT